MTTRRNFDKDYVEKELQKLSPKLPRKITAYVAGGAAMALTGLKEATKDIDVVLEEAAGVKSLLSALRKLGYEDPRTFLTVGLPKTGARALLQNRDGFRWDIFERVVADRLCLSPRMTKRGQEYRIGPGKLRLKLLSKEDIFLLKSVTDREGDLEDMRDIAESSVNWAVIAEECRWQAAHSKMIWENALCERLKDLRTRYGIASPIEKEVCRSAAQKILKLGVKDRTRPKTKGPSAADRVRDMRRKRFESPSG